MKKRTINNEPMKYSMQYENNRLVLYRYDSKSNVPANNSECEFWYKIEELEEQLAQEKEANKQLLVRVMELTQRNIDAGLAEE